VHGLSKMGDFDGLVVRNTFLDFSEHTKTEEELEEAINRRPRAVSDLTDTKLPWKVPLSDQAAGLYQVTRRRLGSNADEGLSPVAGELALGTVEEEEAETSARKRGARSSRGGAGRRTRENTAEVSPVLGGLPNLGCFPGHLHFGPPGAIPMLPGYPYPSPWGFPGGMPPWGQFPMWGYPGTLPGAPGMCPQDLGAFGLSGQAVGKGVGKKGGISGGNSGDRGFGGAGSGQKAARGGSGGAVASASTAGKGGAEGATKTPLVALAQPQGEPTTVMLRNIPNRYTSGSLLALLNEHEFQGCYDFVYLPMDFQNGVNLGYAFVNLLTHQDALRFKDLFQGFNDWRFDSAKVSEVSWAHPHQGLDEHVERYRNSPVMHPSMPDEYKPMIFQNGQRVNFPAPTRVIKAPKLRLGRDRPRDGGRDDGAREGVVGEHIPPPAIVG